MKTRIDILEAIRDCHLLGKVFPPGDWSAWEILLKACFALGLTPGEHECFSRYTGRSMPPSRPVRELWAIVGRRGGKSWIAATCAVFLACFRNYDDLVARGERPMIMLVAVDRRQAGILFQYVARYFEVPLLASLVKRRRPEIIELHSGVAIRVQTANFRTIGGYTVVAAICDEIAFWRNEHSLNPDAEILAALRPAMLTVREPLLMAISSPYARRGTMWEAYQQYYARPSDHVLVWKAPTLVMNPLADRAVIEAAFEGDPPAAAAEYGAEFRSDLETFVTREVAEACVVRGRTELLPDASYTFVAFVDTAGGGGPDAMTLAIAHKSGDVWIIDLLRECRPPFSPAAAVQEFATDLRRFGLRTVTGDSFGGRVFAEYFRQHGMEYRDCRTSKSELYHALLPWLNSGKIELLDDRRLVTQLCALERRTAWGGRSSIDHPVHGHDDMINAVAGVVALEPSPPLQIWAM